MNSFCISADYLIDKNWHVGEVFLSLPYDGGFSIGDRVFVQDNQMYDILKGTVTMPPTTYNKYHTITLVNDSSIHNVVPSNLYDENDVQSAGKPSTSLGFFRPHWLKQGQKITILHNDVYKQGYLNINTDNLWEFVARDFDGRSCHKSRVNGTLFLSDWLRKLRNR